MKKGFTLIELIVVIIIVGILATLGFTQYTKLVEKGRTAEAKQILGDIRTAAVAYYMERSTYSSVADEVGVTAPTLETGSHYFYYSLATNGFATATRSTGAGKAKSNIGAYTIAIDYHNGTFSGTAGMY